MTQRIPIILLLLLAAGCQTTRYDAEVRQAAGEVGQRTGWAPQWSAPWADQVPQWDSQSPLTIEQAVTIALENNRQIRADVETIGSARADFVQAGLLPNPVISAAYRFPVGDTPYVLPLSAMQTVSDLWHMTARTDAAHASLQEAVLRVSAGALELIAKVKTSHARIIEIQRSQRLLADNAATLEQARKLAVSKFDAGTGNQLDVSRVEIEQMENQSAISTGQTELANEKLALLELLGLAGATIDWEAADLPPAPGTAASSSSAWRFSDPTATLPSESALVTLAGTQRLDVLAAQWNYESLVHKLRDEKLGIIPKLDLGVDFEKSDPAGYTIGPSGSLEVPIFDQNQAHVADARAQLARSWALLAAARQQATREVRQAFRNYQSLRQQVDFYQRRLLPIEERNLHWASLAFNQGDSDLTVLLDVQRSINAAQLKLAELQRDLAIAQAELERAAGGRVLLSTVFPATRPAGTQPAETQPAVKNATLDPLSRSR